MFRPYKLVQPPRRQLWTQVQHVFEQTHSVTGLPWPLTIIAVTMGARIVLTMPLSVYMLRQQQRHVQMLPYLKLLQDQYQARLKQLRGSSEQPDHLKLKLLADHLRREVSLF